MADMLMARLLGRAERVRLLPVVMLAAGLLLAVKLGHVVPGVGAALAESKPDPKAARVGKVTPDEVAGAKLPERTPSPSAQRPMTTPSELSPAEIAVLHSLAKRREHLEADAAKRDKELALKASLLTAAEAKVEERIAELKKIEAQIGGLLKKYDEQEEKRIRSLVKVYESMKPKDAARIFEEMDGALLLDMIERMKEQKLSVILSLLEPAKAKKITQELATRRPLPTGG